MISTIFSIHNSNNNKLLYFNQTRNMNWGDLVECSRSLVSATYINMNVVQKGRYIHEHECSVERTLHTST